jgi:hypothetical protein
MGATLKPYAAKQRPFLATLQFQMESHYRIDSFVQFSLQAKIGSLKSSKQVKGILYA